MKKISILFSLLLPLWVSAQSFDSKIGTRYKYVFWVMTEMGREEYAQKMVVTDYSDERIEFFYETTSLNVKEGKLVMKAKGIRKGKYDERLLKGGEKVLRKETAFWLSRKQFQSLQTAGEFRWGKSGDIRYVKKADIFYNVQFNDSTKAYPAIQVAWEGNTKYKMTILDNPQNPLILANEYIDANNQTAWYRMSEVVQKELPYQRLQKDQIDNLMKDEGGKKKKKQAPAVTSPADVRNK